MEAKLCGLCSKEKSWTDGGIIKIRTANMSDEVIAKHGEYAHCFCCDDCYETLKQGETVIVMCSLCNRFEAWTKSYFQKELKNVFDHKTMAYFLQMPLITIEVEICLKCKYQFLGQVAERRESAYS